MGQISYTLPSSGLPNSTQDPLITTALSTLLTLVNGNVEATNLLPASGIAVLKPTSKSANYSVAAGDLVRVTAASTMTLPGHSAGQLVGIVSQVSSGAVTVSGSNINGVGLTSASSFTLGAYGAFAVLEDNGSDWSIVAGQQDTGWTALTLSTNIGAASGYYAPTARLTGDRVFLRGAVQNNTGSPQGNAYTFATIPAGLRPASPILGLALPFQSTPAFMTIAAAGGMTLAGSGISWGAGAQFGMDGISYSIS